MRLLCLVVVAGLALAAVANAQPSRPTTLWLAQAQCVHQHEGPWNANTGNGYFGGMQMARQTWMGVNGRSQPAFAHPGDPAYPFSASPQEQLHRAWLVWLRDGRTWRSWGAVGATCSAPALSP